LRKKVVSKIEELGVKDASKFFGVSAGTVSNWATGKTSPSITALELVLSLDSDDDWIRADARTQLPREQYCEPELFQWTGKDAIILLPVYRTFNADTHFTLFANYAKYGPEKLGMIQEKRTIIHEARNILVH
jgi:transcriptional regulator with XRE-family HTH domain